MRRVPAFTLVELLVVVTIIIVLLAMLSPALSRAVYQAQLAVCGAQAGGAAGAITVYALDSRRHYPYRTLVHTYDGGVVMSPERLTMAVNPGNQTASWDDRPPLRDYMRINSLSCPLAVTLDLESDSGADTFVYSSYALFYSWQYRHGGDNPVNGVAAREKGMFKVGDRWTWSNPLRDEGGEFSTLLSDGLVVNPNGGGGRAPHPDKRNAWALFGPFQRAPNPFGPAGSEMVPGWGETWGFATLSWWGGGGNRGGVDMNAAGADGGVRRYNDVTTRPEKSGLRLVPTAMDNRQNQPGRFVVPLN